MSPEQGYLAAHVIKPLAVTLAHVDEDANRLQIRNSTRQLGEAPVLLPAEQADELLKRWMALSDPAACVMAARRFDPAQSAALHHLVLCSNSLREGLYYLEKFSGLLSEQMSVQVMRHRSGMIRVRISLRQNIRSNTDRWRMELLLSTLVSWLCQLCGPQLKIEHLYLPWEEQPYGSLYAQRWNTSVSFDNEHCVMEFQPKSLDMGLHQTNPNITMLLRREVETHFRKLVRSGALADHIASAFSTGVLALSADQKEVAEHFHISPRTLNRYLQKDNTSLKQLITEARIHMARDLLMNTRLGIDEIAQRLGLSGRRALDRIFTRSENISPARYRDQSCFQSETE
ncbi:helix-turn-helix transcriptional regulator [Parathalassolituus penaei]|uniref:AraC family transcriptional regulator ligand-binding domain-containing protein n=1 Tax=Parathalassolituus penaei TaxID=2997323 RepID=A0A9X3IS30_9GAMM|nr:AraC family transcriptional regulator [Parathalassolituus penaei]MCY0963728.1 AraC family transcriptional regulator ligand-binding domain-containing protein [Parathalassolituus penaei]